MALLALAQVSVWIAKLPDAEGGRHQSIALCNATLRYATLRYATLCYAMLCYATLC